MVSPRPSCVSVRPSMMVWPPSSRMPTSNDTRVRVDGFSKIMASVLPPNGFSVPPIGTCLFHRLAVIQDLAKRLGIDLVKVEEMLGCRHDGYSAALAAVNDC